ncbi:myosin regulatory light chain 2 [Lepeophtheirus salmonis]|nr:myosin regulatory light chain 2-like [Lepeophtheirus salmonis]
MGKGSNGFSEEQVEIYRECFRLMDMDKDGVISKTDLRAAFDNVGRLMMEPELDAMLAEMNGPCNFDNMLRCFETKMAGDVNDPDDLILNAFKVYDEEISETVKGVTTVKHIIDRENFRQILMCFGDKMTAEEIDDIFEEFDYDDDTGGILTKSAVDLFVAGGMDEKEENKKEEEKDGKKAEAAQTNDAAQSNTPSAGEGAKKKKKKKKAAK